MRKPAARPDPSAPIWERAQPLARPAPSPLSREAIVHAAVALADAEGLAAVSLRNVGAALSSGPMRLYGYLSTKEELLDLMVDAVYGEMERMKPAVSGPWRNALRTIAQRTRRASQKHPWFADLLGGRPHQGPHALAHLEASLATLDTTPGFEDINAVMQAVRALNAYVIGAVRGEAAELQAARQTGMSKAEWQQANGPYIQRMIATGSFPTLEKVVRDADHPTPDAAFEAGLNLLLAGIESSLCRPLSGRRATRK